ncbi:MAG: TonB family protein [Candidatus Acidiferrales bacterium]
MPTPTKAPVNALDQAIESPGIQASVRPAQPSDAHSRPPAVPVGVLEVPVGVWGIVSVPGQPEPLKQFSEETCTVIVFPHGGVIRLSAAVVPGQMVLVANRKSHQEVLCRVVNVKKYPNVKGYVEIQFTQPTDGFWGAYVPQGAVNSPAGAETPVGTEERPPEPQPAASAPASAPKLASMPSLIPAASAAPIKPPTEAPASPDDFWSSSFPTEIFTPSMKAAPKSTAPPMIVTASPVPRTTVRPKPEPIGAIQTPSIEKPVRSPVSPVPPLKAKSSQKRTSGVVPSVPLAIVNSSELTQPSRRGFELVRQRSESPENVSTLSSPRNWLGSWLTQLSASGATASARFTSRPMVLAGAAMVALFVVGAAGFFFFHRGTTHPAATDQTNPALLALSASNAANTVQGLPSASSPAPVESQPPVVVPAKSQPPTQAQDSAAGVSDSPPALDEPAPRKRAWARQIPSGRLLFSHATRPTPAAVVRTAPPDATVVPLDLPSNAIQAVLPQGSKILPVLPLTPPRAVPAHGGGRLKETQLISKVPPNYPSAARQIGVEGKVVIDAVVDITGNVTNIKVVSGPALLQYAAVDAVSKWKYAPRYLDDKPVPAEMLITVEFRLR